MKYREDVKSADEDVIRLHDYERKKKS